MLVYSSLFEEVKLMAFVGSKVENLESATALTLMLLLLFINYTLFAKPALVHFVTIQFDSLALRICPILSACTITLVFALVHWLKGSRRCIAGTFLGILNKSLLFGQVRPTRDSI